jgi:L-ribulose-5-phosphate 3-epimerase
VEETGVSRVSRRGPLVFWGSVPPAGGGDTLAKVSHLLRREFLAAPLAAGVAGAARRNRIDRSRLSAISDEIARSPADAIAFARQYGLQWLELRAVPGLKTSYFKMNDAELKAAAREFKDAGIGISFLNTGMLKFGLPGTEPLRRTPDKPEDREKRMAAERQRFDDRMKELESAIRAAHILDTRKVRIFAFSRVAEPESVFPRVAEVIGEMAHRAGKEGISLLIENEASCNVATCAELAAMARLVPASVGINWDADNGQSRGEKPFPDGYQRLPHKRVWNVQIKGRTVLDYPQKLDWAGIFHALEHDGYKGQVGLETHIFGEQQVAMSHASMKEILRLVGLPS